jgi:hypothetical protein
MSARVLRMGGATVELERICTSINRKIQREIGK